MLKSKKVTVLRIDQLGDAVRAGVSVAQRERSVRAMYTEPLEPIVIGRIGPDPSGDPSVY